MSIYNNLIIWAQACFMLLHFLSMFGLTNKVGVILFGLFL